MKNTVVTAFLFCCAICFILRAGTVGAQETDGVPTLQDVRKTGTRNSSFLSRAPLQDSGKAPQANLSVFRDSIQPVLKNACSRCHGHQSQEADFRVDTLSPDLLHGPDVQWWVEVFDVISNGEMPPADEAEMSDDDRKKVIEWLSAEIQVASQVRRSEQGHTSFRRLTRYEYNYVMRDLLGLPYDFAKDLPPETPSEDGFTNSSEVLQMTAMQFQTYRDVSRNALRKATVRERPNPLYWGIPMESLAKKLWRGHESGLAKIKKKHADDPDKLQEAIEKHNKRYKTSKRGTHFRKRSEDLAVKAQWHYRGASFAMSPTDTRSDVPDTLDSIAVLPAKQKLVVELGDQLPDAGVLRIRFRAWRTSVDDERVPQLALMFGHQASNNSSAEDLVSDRDISILATEDAPQFYQWEIPLSEIVRNPLRGVAKLGSTPNPSEYLKLHNHSSSPTDVHIDYVEVTASAYDQWPPQSHRQVFIDSVNQADETKYAREVIANFMPRAWRRSVTAAEIDRKLELFHEFRPRCDDFQEAVIEVLSTVLSSPNFLYVTQSSVGPRQAASQQADFQLATRLSMFLWSSAPDRELLDLAERGELRDTQVLASQTRRMLDDPRSERFAKHFVHGWLGMQLLDFLRVDKKAHPQFDKDLQVAMQGEPVAFFHQVLQNNRSVMDFLHADYAMVNERLARHYGLSNVYGNQFREVALANSDVRGGLLTQAGLLAMNSDGKDSHPLKRGIWLLERLLNDPPPPPPPAVPEIDLADPKIAEMTLKQRMEDHRNDPACISCHAKIDPWGIALENFDATGSWRDKIKGEPVDATSVLFNKQELGGIDGLKRFLLSSRQDQFARAIVHKMTTYALGRPLTFSDRSEIDKITTDLRKHNDELATLVTLIVTSELFQ